MEILGFMIQTFKGKIKHINEKKRWMSGIKKIK
jgi:hypothetical protein